MFTSQELKELLPKLKIHARSFTYNAYDDLIQDTLLKACAKSFDPTKGTKLNWLKSIMKHQFFDTLASNEASIKREQEYFYLNLNKQCNLEDTVLIKEINNLFNTKSLSEVAPIINANNKVTAWKRRNKFREELCI